MPTFRPDRYLEPAGTGLGRPDATGSVTPPTSTPTTTRAISRRWRTGAATSSPTAPSPPTTAIVDLDTTPAWTRRRPSRIYRPPAPAGRPSTKRRPSAGTCCREMARMSCDDGLVMTVHPGRPAATTTARRSPRFGLRYRPRHPDRHRIHQLRCSRCCERFGTHPNLHLVLFTVDADTFSREIAPLAGFYPSVFVGAPWWFLDNPTEIRHFQRSVTETAGLHQAFRIHRRHPGLLLDPGPARHVPPAGRRVPGRTRRRAPTGSGRGAGDSSSTLVDDQPRRCSSCDRAGP